MTLRRNATASLIGTATLTTANLIIVTLVLRNMGPDVFGAWAIIATLLSIAALGDLGLTGAMTYYVGRVSHLSLNNAAGFVWAGCLLALGIGTLLGAGLYMSAELLVHSVFRVPETLRGSTVTALGIASLIVPVALVGSVIRGGIDGLGAMVISNAIIAGQSFMRVVLFGLAVFLDSGIIGLSVATLVATCCAWSFGGWYLARRLSWKAPLPRDLIGNLRALLSYGAIIQIGNGLSAVWEPALRVIISRRFGVAQLGFFEAGYSVARTLRALLQSTLYALLPEAAKRRQSPTGLVDLYDTTLRHTVAIGVLIGGFALVCAEPLFRLVIGEHAPPVYEAFWAMMLALTPSILHSPLYFLLQGSGHARVVTTAMSVTVATALGATLVLIDVIGYRGVFVGYGMATLFATAYLVIRSTNAAYGLRRITIKWFLDVRVWSALGLSMGATVASRSMWITSFWQFVGSSAVFVAIFGAVLLLTSYYSVKDFRGV